MASSKNMPKDAQVMATILKESGITEYEPRVLNQMLEFTYRYVTSVLEDAQLFCSHAKKSSIDVDDVRIAIKLQTEKYFTKPPLREVLFEIAAQKNSTPLPLIKATVGPRLPPDRYSLTSCNYKLKSSAKKRLLQTAPRLNITSLHSASSMNKLGPQMSLNKNSSASLSVVTKPGVPTIPGLVRPVMPPVVTKSYPTPIIKFPENNRPSLLTPSTSSIMAGSMPTSQIVLPIKKEFPIIPEHGEKRKLDDFGV